MKKTIEKILCLTLCLITLIGSCPVLAQETDRGSESSGRSGNPLEIFTDGGYKEDEYNIFIDQVIDLHVVTYADDTAEVTYSWEKDGVTISGENTDTLAVSGSDKHDHQYTCIAVDDSGNQDSVVFSVLYFINVIANGSGGDRVDLYLDPGESATLNVDVPGYNIQDLDFTWVVNKDGVQDDLPNEDGKTAISVTGEKNCFYCCWVFDNEGNAAVAWFFVNINNNFSVEANGNGTKDDVVHVGKGEDTVLFVNATADNDSGITYTWSMSQFDDNGEWTPEVVLQENSRGLDISDIREWRKYRCDVRDQYGNTDSVNFEITVENNLQVVVKDSYTNCAWLPVTPGDGIVLEVEATADDDSWLRYTWDRSIYIGSDENMDYYECVETQVKTVPVWEITSVTQKEGYSCTVSDKYGNTANANFEVLPEYDLEVSVNGTGSDWDSATLNLNDQTTFTVDAWTSGPSDLTYTWRVERYSSNGEYTSERINDVTGNSLEITVTGTATYVCEVRDEYGIAKLAYYRILVDNNLRVRANDTDNNEVFVYLEPGEGSTLTIEVHAYEEDGLTYTWRSFELDSYGNWVNETALGETGNELYIVMDGTAKDYYCVVTDKYGNTVDVYFRVRIQNDLSVTANDTGESYDNIQLAPGEGTVLIAKAYAKDEDGLTYRWYSDGPVNGEWVHEEYPDVIGNELIIPAGEVSARDYYCEVRDKYANSCTASFHVSIENELWVKANDSESNESYVYLGPYDGTTLIAEVHANDEDGLTYRWYSEGPVNNEWVHEEYPDILGNEFVICAGDGVRKDYFCEITDKYGNSCYAYFYVYIENDLWVRANNSEGNEAFVYLNSGEGTTLVTETHANDENGITYRWYAIELDSNGGWINETILEETGNELSVVMDGTAKDYRCTVTDRFGNSTQAYFRVRIQNNLIVIANDTGECYDYIQLTPGTGTVLTVDATASEPDGLTYRWWSDKVINSEWTYEEYPDITGNEFTVPAEDVRANYYCEVRDKYGNKSLAEFHISIENNFWAEANESGNSTTTINLSSGEGTTLVVNAHANEEDGLTYCWVSYELDSNGDWINGTVLDETGNELHVVMDGTSKDYRCEVYDKYGNVVGVEFHVRIQNNLSVTANDSGETSVVVRSYPDEETVLIANAHADDEEGLTYRWYSYRPENTAWVGWYYEEYPDVTGNEFVIPAGEGSRRIYHCEVRDKYDNSVCVGFDFFVENDLEFTISDTGNSEEYIYLYPNEETILSTDVYANNENGLTSWWYASEMDIYGNWINETALEETGSELRVVMDGTNRDYRCEVRDEYMNTLDVYFRVRIQNDLSVTANDSGDTSVNIQLAPEEGTELKANVIAHDTDGLTYRWYSDTYLNGESVHEEYQDVTGNIFVIPDGEAAKRDYCCEVTDRYGNTERVYFHVRVDNELSLKANENNWESASVTVLAGEGTVLTVHVSAKDVQGITYRWYFQDNVIYQQTEVDPSNTSGNVLDIPLVEQSGQYRCEVTDRYGNSATAWFTVRVDNHLSAKDKETGYHEVKIELAPGGSKTLEVEFSALDTLGITTKWEKRNYYEDGWYWTEEIPDYDGLTKLTLTDVSEHTGYSCLVIDRFGNTSQVGYEISVNHLVVTANGSSDSKQTINVTPGERVRLALTVTADNYNGITYSWDKGEYDEYGYNYQQTEELPDELSNFIVVDNVSSRVVYRCTVTDAYGSRKQMFFELVPENHLVVTVYGREVPAEGILYQSKAVKRGNDLTLTVEADADDKTDLSFVWQGDGEVSTSASASTYTVRDVEEGFNVYCTVTDRYGNTRRIRFVINLDETIERFIGTDSAERLNGLDSCFNVFQTGEMYTITIAPCKTESEINALLDNGITTSDLYYWMVYRRPIDRIDVDYLVRAAHGIGALVENVSIVDQNLIQYSLGIKLCVNSDESAVDYYDYCDYLSLYPCTYKDVLNCTDGPSDHPSFSFGVSAFSKAEYRDGSYFDIVYDSRIPMDGIFEIQYIREEGTYIITPLVTKEEYRASAGDPADTIYAIDGGLGINYLIFNEDLAFEEWFEIIDSNSNLSGTGAGDAPNSAGCGMAILAWTENDLTFTARGRTPSGDEFTKTIRIITHAEPAGGPTSLTEPELKSISNTSSGVKIAWEKSAGATKYRVYRSEDGGDWNAIADVGDVATYTDKTAVTGKTYSYTVCCLSDDGKNTISPYDPDGITITFVTPPALKSASNTATGVKFTWVKSEGATKYRVYRKSGSSGWSKLADVGNVSSYTDTTAVSGTEYKYTVRGVSAAGDYSAYDSAGVSVTYYAPPILNSASSVSSGITVSWEKVDGITGYRVYRKTDEDSSWSKLADVGDVSSYTDKTVEAGQTYFYTVRCLSADGKSTVSAHDPDGLTATFIAAPVLKSVSNAATGVKFTWVKSEGAVKYRVYRKEGSGSWKKLADVGDVNTYTDTTAVSGTTYSYTVRCLSEDGKSTVSGYDSTGKSVTYYAAPVLESVTSSSSGLTISWEKSAGAVKYRVYRKSGDSGWSKLADVGDVSSYTDKTAEAGTEYKYTVRCLSEDGSSTISSYDPEGISGMIVAAPVLKSAANAATGVKVTWVKSAGAVKYRVYRKEGSGSWKKIADVGDVNTYTDTTAVSGTEYKYTVRCLSEDGKSTISGYDTEGKSVTYYAAPVLKSTSNTSSGVTVNWEKSAGAVKYRVYRKSGDSGWSKIADVGDVSSYTDKKAAAGTTYKYTVRCLSEDGSSTISSYDSNGIEATYIAPPVLVSATSTSEGVTVEWEASAGAVNYRVFRKVSGGSWSRVGDTTDTTFTDTTGTLGTTYLYTVRCVTADGKSYTSAYDSKGLSALYE